MSVAKLPKLHTGPNYEENTEVKCGYTGATVLVHSKQQVRYRGSRQYTLDSDGTLEEKPKKRKQEKPESVKVTQRQYKVNKSEVKARIQAMINCQTGHRKLYFFTVSFPPCVVDDVAYKVLNSILTTARKNWNLTHYVWVAERQKIGTIHYHIATSNRMPVQGLNEVVKNCLKYHIGKKSINWNYTAANKYNGVDIAKNRTTGRISNFADISEAKNLAKYLTKYATKGDEVFTRQAWQASKSVTALFTHVCLSIEEFDKLFLDYIDASAPLYESEYYMFYPWKNEPPPSILARLSQVNATIAAMT